MYNFPEADIPEENGDGKAVWDTGVRRTKDTDALSTMIENELKINMTLSGQPKITNAIRQGRRLVDDKPRSTPRPIKITFTDITVKREVLSNSKKLRDSLDITAKGVFFNPDLTAEQRKRDKELRDEMWAIREKEQRNVAIKKGKIVEVPHEVRKTRKQNNATQSTNSGTM